MPVQTRGEPAPDPAVVVVRGGLHSLDPDKVVDDATDAFLRDGHYAISTFGALDGDIKALCQRVPRLGNPGPGQLWVARVGDLREGGFDLLDTPPDDHFDVVLPDLESETVDRLRSCFLLQQNPLRPPKGVR